MSEQAPPIPDPRMYAPELFIPGRKPVGPVKIDWTHPITKDLAHCVLADGPAGYDLVTSTKIDTFDNNAPVPRGTAAGLGNKADDSSLVYHTFGSFTSFYNCTMLYHGDVGSGRVSGDRVFAWGTSNTNRAITLGTYDANNIEWWCRNEDASQFWHYSASADLLTPGTPQVVLGRCIDNGSDNTVESWVGGVSQAAEETESNGGEMRYDTIAFHGLRRNSSSSYSDGIFLAGMIWLRALSDAEIQKISRDPYQFLTPA